jgi:MFS family permease
LIQTGPRFLDRIPPDLRHLPSVLIYMVGLSSGFALGMVTLLVPLYILHLGHDAAIVGLVVSSQSIFQVPLRFMAGALSDRFGERSVLWLSFAFLAVGAAAMIVSVSLWVIFPMQIIIGIARSIYWTPSQSYASRSFGPNASIAIGRQVSFEAMGQMAGAAGAGFSVVAFGFGAAFGIGAGLAVLGAVIVTLMPRLARKEAPRTIRASLAPIPGLLRNRTLHLAGVIAFVSATVISLQGSVYPVFLKEVGYDEAGIGVLRAVNSVGTMVVAFIFGVIVANFGQRRLMGFSLALIGGLVVLSTLAAETLWAAVLVFLVMGIIYANLRSLYPTMGAQNSSPEQRGMAISVVGMYWGIAQLIIPVTFGFIAKYLGAAESLWIAAGLFITLSVLTPLLFRVLGPRQPAANPEST